MLDVERILKKINDILYKSLTARNNEFESFHTNLTQELKTIKKELYDAYKLYTKYSFLRENFNELKRLFKRIRGIIGDQKIFGYGFYHFDEDKPLYVGVTENGVKRIKQHFQWYSSAFKNFPMYFLTIIKVWTSERLNSTNLKRFEDYLIKELNPYFNKKRSESYKKDELDIYLQAIKNEKQIQFNDFTKLLKKIS